MNQFSNFFDTRSFLPSLYTHSSYSNMVDKVHSRTKVSWSFYIDSGDGKLVVIQSQPELRDSSFGKYLTSSILVVAILTSTALDSVLIGTDQSYTCLVFWYNIFFMIP